MITIAGRLPLPFLIPKPKSNSFIPKSLHPLTKPCSILCKSQLSFTAPTLLTSSLSPHFFTATSESHLVAAPTVYDVLVDKHHFSPQTASLVASELTRTRSPEKADSILSFLEASGFSSVQLEKLVKCRPRILTASCEDEIRSKIGVFQQLGFSSADIAHITSSNQSILQVTAKNRIVPSLTLLNELLGSDLKSMAKLLKKCPWFVTADLEKLLMPNIEILKGFGMPMEAIHRILFSFPRFLLVNPEIMQRSVEKAKEMGASQSSGMFVYAVRVFASMSDKVWEGKLRALRDMGFSDSDVVEMFGKAPQVFMKSMKKIKKVKKLLVSTGKFDVSSIVDHPCLVGCSIEKRLKPRLQILSVLESKKLIEKWPSLGTIYSMSDDKFFARFVSPYSEKVGRAFKRSSF